MKDNSLAEQTIQLSPISTRTIFYHQAVADYLGLNSTDHKCLLFLMEERKTMGQLSQLTGLTMSAQTAAIERLERAGYVRRTPDHDDRRRVYAEIVPANVKEVAELFRSLGKSIAQLETTYSPHELDLIHGYMQQSADILYHETLALKESLTSKKRGSQ